MEKRTLIAVVVCMGILLVWSRFFPSGSPTAPKTPPAATAPAGKPGEVAPAGTPGSAPSGPAGSTTRQPEQRVSLQTPLARYVFSSWGAALVEVKLLEPKFRSRKDDPESGTVMLAGLAPEQAPLLVSFPKGDFKWPAGASASWAVSRPAPDAVTFRLETDTVAVEKRYRIEGASYRLLLDVVVENRGDKPVDESLALHLFGRQDPERKGGGFFAAASANPTEMVCFVEGKVERKGVDSLASKGEDDKVGLVRWIAADEKYFTVAAVLHPETPARERKCGLRAVDSLVGEAFVSFSPRMVAAHATTTYPFTLFVGPKYASELEQVTVAGEDPQLGKVVNVTFAVLARPLLHLLKFFHGLIGNWGLAIILLTFFVKLVTFYPTQRAMMSGKKMQRLAPELAKIRKKFENDRQRQGVETMKLYKENGVSPVGGCLPSLITMPIWIALFSTLNYSVELHRSGFLFYIHDLSARDPYFVTPLLMGAIMFMQMRMSPAGTDPQQQKMMSVMMPLMFTSFSLFLPAGLAIYTLTNSLLAILQQLIVNRMDKKLGPIATA